jgi:hypothetical protein
MTHPDYIRQKAIELRRDQDLTIDEIAERLAMSRGTIYSWVRDIEITRKPGWKDRTEAQKRGTKSMQAKFERKRELAYNAARHSFYALAEDPTFRDFICIYIGEGYKRSRNKVSVANSDPTVVELANRWITKLTSNKVVYSIQYHADQNLNMLRGFWSNRLGIRPDQIRLQRKSNSSGLKARTWRSQFGVMTVGVGDTQLRARLQGWIDELQISWLDSASPGCSEAWLSRRPWEAETAGSNPATPITSVQIG